MIIPRSVVRDGRAGPARVFSRDVVFGGEIAFVGRENVKNIQKTNEIRYCLGGKFKT